MNDTLSSTRSSPALVYVVAIGAVILALAAVLGFPARGPLLPDGAAVADAPAGRVLKAQRTKKQTKGQLEQLALHLSKMEGGESVGGFPGFEPPEDDEEYQRKIKDRDYSFQDVNDWVKEINNFLGRIIKRNPRMSFEKILQRQGLSPGKIDNFIEVLQRAEYTARGMSGYGVNPARAQTLRSLMKTLGVSTW